LERLPGITNIRFLRGRMIFVGCQFPSEGKVKVEDSYRGSGWLKELGMTKMKWYKIVSWSVSCDRQILNLLAGLRVEWCKARARSMRWAEEVELLQEEMRRVSCFLRWHASWWNKKNSEHTLGTAANMEGLGAYAYRQAQLRDDLANCFENKWAAHLPLTTACSTTYPADSASKTVMANEAELDLYLPKLPLP
jgi:hypothetical protein